MSGVAIGRAGAMRSRVDWRKPAIFTGAMLAALGLGIMLGVFVLPPGFWHHRNGLLPNLLAWDAGWYSTIATQGYQWDALAGGNIGHYQDVAFFPLYPLIERAAILLTGSRSIAVMILPGALSGIASVPVFFRLARRLMPESDAACATMLYALYPAASFFIMGYPTGLMNLLVMLALLDIMDGRRWRAALWCGIGTAGGPLLVFLSFVLCVDQGVAWLRARMPAREIPPLIGFGLLSVSGLLAYIAFQWIMLGHPLAFLSAQSAWGAAPKASIRLGRLISPPWYYQNIGAYAAGAYHALARLRITHSANYMIEIFLGKISVLLALAGVIASFRIRPLVVPFSGLGVLLGYVWFIDTIQNATSAMRLLYPVLPIFLGLALLLRPAPRLLRGLVMLLFAGLLVLQTGLVVAGYWVV
ncbi:MAG TPA: mannosyltransferase family protein [Acetobacteraceae bacterium]|nr:mannosyltransferase family protein [Acetobacteraceae bacterium]